MEAAQGRMHRWTSAAAFLVLPAAASAADRSYTVTGYDRIRVEAPYAVTLATGKAPFARATGSPQALDAVRIEVQGRTLVVRQNRTSGMGSSPSGHGPVTIVLGTHDLTAAWLNGAGSLDIDRLKGLSASVEVTGAGALRIGDAAVDRLAVGLTGAASAQVAGRAAAVTAIVRGASRLDAAALTAKDATLAAEGPASISMAVTNSANLSAAGTGQISLTGNPACKQRVTGSVQVSGCR